MLLDYSTFTSFSSPTVRLLSLIQVLIQCSQYTTDIINITSLTTPKKINGKALIYLQPKNYSI